LDQFRANSFMALSQRLQIRQSQALVMTPQLMQAIKLLQLSNLDLVAYVEAELEQNPLLDRGAEEEPPPAQTDGTPAPDQPAVDGETWSAAESAPSANAAEDSLDTRVEDSFPDHVGEILLADAADFLQSPEIALG